MSHVLLFGLSKDKSCKKISQDVILEYLDCDYVDVVKDKSKEARAYFKMYEKYIDFNEKEMSITIKNKNDYEKRIRNEILSNIKIAKQDIETGSLLMGLQKIENITNRTLNFVTIDDLEFLDMSCLILNSKKSEKFYITETFNYHV